MYRFHNEGTVKNDPVLLSPKYDFNVTIESTERADRFRIEATSWDHALDKALIRMFGFRSRYLSRSKRIVRVGRHSRIKKTLLTDVSIRVEEVEA